MGEALISSAWGSTAAFSKTESHEVYSASRAEVSPEGDSCVFKVKYENREPFSVFVPFSSISMLYHEVRTAAQLMIHRQRLTLDRGVGKMLEICAAAVRPSTLEVLVEPDTGDRLVVAQFTEHAPFCLRLSPEQASELGMKIKEAAEKTAH